MQRPCKLTMRFLLAALCALVLVSCSANQPSTANRQTTRSEAFQIDADGNVTREAEADKPLVDEALASALTDYAENHAANPSGSTSGHGVWSNVGGPELTLIVDLEAKHSALQAFVDGCAQHGIHRFLLRNATDGRSIAFAAPVATASSEMADDELPPLKIRLSKAGEGESDFGITVNERRFASLEELNKFLISVVGDERGPGSIAETALAHLDCDGEIPLQAVFDVCDAATTYIDSDGNRVTFLEHFSPVAMGNVEEVLEAFEPTEAGVVPLEPTEIPEASLKELKELDEP